MWYLVAIAFIAGFAGGWAFFKHRQHLKEQAALIDARLREDLKSRFKGL